MYVYITEPIKYERKCSGLIFLDKNFYSLFNCEDIKCCHHIEFFFFIHFVSYFTIQHCFIFIGDNNYMYNKLFHSD